MVKEKLYTLIQSPIITEQTARLGENFKQIVFKVDLSANKREIKKAVEELFKVEVLGVTTSIVKGKRKRNRFGMYKKSNYKKAFVSISEDSEIQFEGIN
ncbi:MAG: 50S ribosomal protein L23 [Gammaproteobacteria bacterium]|nr:50S ribosomal protein L23 [Gammaproteobacteria bacterium]|tara:strand:- start:19559 stop:19855 length:297 start_codon:yes stop_codon:yes gene_type:complete